MSITYTDETPKMAATAQAVQVQQPNSFAALEAQAQACYSFLKFIEVCAKVDPNTLTATIEVKVFGDTVASGTLSAANPCLNVNVHPHAAGIDVKLEVSICLDIPGKNVTISGKACVDYLIGHKCAHLDKHTIIHF
jgi:hypothetical protein